MEDNHVITSIRCMNCIYYKNPMVVRKYTASDKMGWVTCLAGNTINKFTRACGKFKTSVETQTITRVKSDQVRNIKRIQ